jgi:hypothetical protein
MPPLDPYEGLGTPVDPYEGLGTPEPTSNYFADKARRFGRDSIKGIGQLVASPGTALQSAAQLGTEALAYVAEKRGDLKGDDLARAKAQFEQELSLTPAMQGAQALRNVGADVGKAFPQIGPADPARDREIGSAVASGAGSLVPLLATGGMGTATQVLAGGGLMGEQQREDAERSGATPGQQAASFGLGGATGLASEALLGLPAMLRSVRGAKIVPQAMASAEAGVDKLVASQLGKLGPLAPVLASAAPVLVPVVQQTIKSAVRESVQEAMEQVAQNTIAKDIVAYDPTRERTEGVGMAALAGGIVGGGLGGTMQAIQGLDTRKNLAETAATLAAQQEQLLAGRRAAQMFPVDAQGNVTNELPLPEGMRRLETERGVFHYNPQQITADEIFSASAKGAENRALALGSTSKPEAEKAAAKNNEPLVTITERTPEGTEVRSSVINQSAAARTQAEMQPGLTPGNTLAVETPEQTLAGRAPDFLADILNRDAQALAARQAADAKERTAREQRQRDLDAKKENVGEAMQQGDAVLQDSAATFADVQGALKRVQFYAENNALGITQDQRIAAQRQQARLAQRLAALEPAEMARRDLENQKRLADDAAALAAQKAQRTQAKQEFKQEVTAGRDATGAIDYTRLSDDDLATRAQAGDAKAEKILMQRADSAGDDRPTLLDVLARVKLPGTDAALGGELKLLTEGMTPQQRRQLIATKETNLDAVAETLRADHGFSQIQTPADVIDFVERALRGEDIRPDRTGEGQVEFATSEPSADLFEAFIDENEIEGSRFKGTAMSGTECTGYACAMRQALGKRIKILGFSADENPDSSVAAVAGGHDFALLDDRYIVDPWIRDVEAMSQQTVFDIQNPEDAAKIAELYGPQKAWQRVPKAEKLADQNKSSVPAEPRTRLARFLEEIGDRRSANNSGPEFATIQDTFDLGGTPVGIDLPNAVRNLTPRWQEKTLAFESSLDKALYYAGGTNSETRDLVAARLAQQTGLTTGQIATLARQLRTRIEPLTRSAAQAGTIRVPAQMRSEVAQLTGAEFATSADAPRYDYEVRWITDPNVANQERTLGWRGGWYLVEAASYQESQGQEGILAAVGEDPQNFAAAQDLAQSRIAEITKDMLADMDETKLAQEVEQARLRINPKNFKTRGARGQDVSAKVDQEQADNQLIRSLARSMGASDRTARDVIKSWSDRENDREWLERQLEEVELGSAELDQLMQLIADNRGQVINNRGQAFVPRDVSAPRAIVAPPGYRRHPLALRPPATGEMWANAAGMMDDEINQELNYIVGTLEGNSSWLTRDEMDAALQRRDDLRAELNRRPPQRDTIASRNRQSAAAQAPTPRAPQLAHPAANTRPRNGERWADMDQMTPQQLQDEYQAVNEYLDAATQNTAGMQATPSPVLTEARARLADVSAKIRSLPSVSHPALRRIAKFFRKIATRDSAWQFGKAKTKSKDLADILAEYSTPSTRLSLLPGMGRDTFNIEIRNAEGTRIGSVSPSVDNGVVSVYAGGARSNEQAEGGGKNVYQAIFTWAYNNGWKVRGSSLSAVNQFRRTVNMLSSALRYGTTDHLIPYSTQKLIGWIDGDTDNNLGVMLLTLSAETGRRAPDLDRLTYDPKSDTVVDNRDGTRIDSAQLKRILETAGLHKDGFGPATVRLVLAARSELAAAGRGNRYNATPAQRAASAGSLRGVLYARGEGADIRADGRGVDAGPAPAQPQALPVEDNATIEREWTALVRAFPRLAELFKLRIGSIQSEFDQAGYRGQVPSNVEAAVWGQKRLIVIAARAWRDRNNGAALVTHEVAHLFWDTLPTAAKTQLRALHAKETGTKTGPLYTAQGFMRGSIQFERDRLPVARVAADPDLPVKEWFAERIAIINKSWAEGRLDRTEASLLRRLAFELRQLWRQIVETFAIRSNIDPDSELFEAQFRAFILAGADVQIGRNAGTSYAQKKAQFAQRPDFATGERGLSWQRFQEWSATYASFEDWNQGNLNTPGRQIRFAGERFNDYELRLVPVADIVPSQSGEDYLNDSSRETARRMKTGTVVEARTADLAPILLEKDGRTLLDGNHRHAAATLNGDREILAIVPIGPGTGQVVNLREFYDENIAGPDFATSDEMFTTSEMEGDGDQVTYPPTPPDVVEKLEDTLLFPFLGNKSALANKLGGLIKVGVKDVNLIGDMMAGAGYYGNLLAKLGLGAEIPRIHNEWETMRAITFSALKTNPAETIAADEAWQTRFKEIQATIDRDNPTLDVNERLKLKHRAIDAAARAVIEPLLPAGSADPDRKTPIVIAATPNLAGLNLALQNLTPNPITFSFSKEDGKLKPLVTKIQERAAYRKGESGRKLLADYSKHLQFTEVTQSDGYATLTEKAAPNTFFFLDPGYSGDSSNYDSVLDWQTSRAAFQNLLSTTVHDAWRNGAKLFITNNWDQGTALHLRRLGFTVIKETRASGDPELIAINYDSQTGRLIPWTQPINSAGEAGTRPNQAPQRPGRNDAAQRPEPVAKEAPQADGGDPRRTDGQLQARQIELPSADLSREVSPDLQGRLVDGSAAREKRLQEIRDELDQLQNSQEDQSEINARGQVLTDERDRLQAEQRAEQREKQVESSIIDVRHPAAVGTPEPGEAWMMVPRMSDDQLRQERMAVGQHLVDNYDPLGRAGRALLNARIDAIRAEEARRAPQPRRDAEGNALVDPIPKTSRRDALIAELKRGRDMAGEANRTGNDEALKEGTRLVRLAKERLDEEFPGWETAARPTTAQAPSAAPDATDTQPGANNNAAPPPPPAPPIAEAAQPDDAEPSPFTGENEPSEPIRKGKIAEVYGHSSYQPGVFVRTWRKVRDTFVGIRGPIPELPAFPGSALNAADRFIKEKGPQFYNGLREFYRALKSGNDYIQRTAEEQVARITRPLIEAGGKFSADDYAKLQTRQEQARRLRAEGKIVPPGALAEITALQSKMEGNPYVLFNRLVLMLDLKWRHENLKDSRGNPIALPSSLNRTEVNAELARLGQTIQSGPHVALIRTALDRHMQLVKDVAADLQSRELIAAEQLANPYYFPHLTLEIKRGDKTEQRELTPTRVRPGTEADFRGYLQDPVGSRKPIETDYVRALYYHLVQVGAHNLKADAIAQHARPYDVMAEVRARAEQLSRTRGESVSWEQAFNEEFEPAGYVRYGTDSRDAFPTIMVDRDKLARRLGRELTSEDLQQQLARLGMDGVRLMPEDLKETLMAGNRETWIVPARVAEGLRGIADRETRTTGEIEAAMKWALGKWKAWKLFMPWNHIRYEYGNVVADVEKIFSATPGTFMAMPEAAREIRAFWLGGEPSADLRAALKDGVINAITAQEMGGLVRLRAFKEFETTADKVRNAIKRRGSSALLQPLAAPLGLGDFSSPELSAFREAVFRYANFKHNLGRLRAGERPDYGGAYHRDIDAMQDSKPGAKDRAERQAGQISKATFGDYGDISVLGQSMRDKLIPFYSWMEVNFKYHANLFRNLRDMVRANEVSKIEAAGKGARAAATFAAGFGARAAGGFVLRLALPYVAVALWNGGLGAVAGAWDEDDEIEKELSEEDRRRFHIILGRNADGTVNIVYGQTALIDIMKWFSGASFMQQAGSYLNGKTDFPTALAEWRDKIVPDFLNNTVGSFGPYAKIPVTLATKKNPFPDVTDMRTVPAYDMRRVIIGQIADDFTADQIERTVSKDYYAARDFGTWAKQLVLQVRQRDPEAWAFYAIKDKAAEFVEKQTGAKRESSYDAPDQQVLRNFRRAIYKGDVEKATQFYQRLLDYGYTADRFKQSIRAQEPLAGLPKENGLRAAFVASLTPDERRLLDRAQSYYTRINSQRGEERGLFPSERSGAAGLQRFQANPQVDRLRQTMENNRQLDEDARRLQAERALQNSLRNTR